MALAGGGPQPGLPPAWLVRPMSTPSQGWHRGPRSQKSAWSLAQGSSTRRPQEATQKLQKLGSPNPLLRT